MKKMSKKDRDTKNKESELAMQPLLDQEAEKERWHQFFQRYIPKATDQGEDTLKDDQNAQELFKHMEMLAEVKLGSSPQSHETGVAAEDERNAIHSKNGENPNKKTRQKSKQEPPSLSSYLEKQKASAEEAQPKLEDRNDAHDGPPKLVTTSQAIRYEMITESDISDVQEDPPKNHRYLSEHTKGSALDNDSVKAGEGGSTVDESGISCSWFLIPESSVHQDKKGNRQETQKQGYNKRSSVWDNVVGAVHSDFFSFFSCNSSEKETQEEADLVPYDNQHAQTRAARRRRVMKKLHRKRIQNGKVNRDSPEDDRGYDSCSTATTVSTITTSRAEDSSNCSSQDDCSVSQSSSQYVNDGCMF